MKVALELRAQGKDDKALRLFKHALALSPKNPEILTQFGEYMEHNRQDVVTADLMYFQVRYSSIIYSLNCFHSKTLFTGTGRKSRA